MNRATARPGPVDAFVDIETLPTSDPETIAEMNANIKAPGTHKKPETIAAWMADERPLVLQEQVARTALDGTYGRICAIGCAFDDDPVLTWVGDEHDVLCAFFRTVRAMEAAGTTGRQVRYIGHNVRSFDLRFIWQRAVINALILPRTLQAAIASRPWDDVVLDTMTLWNPERERRVSLDRLCRALGVESPKGDMNGSQVAAAWAAGEHERLKAYVSGDVAATRACFKRMHFHA